MAHTNIQSLEKYPHPTTKNNKANNNKQQRHIDNNEPRPTTPTTQWKEITRGDEQEEEARIRGEEMD
jgi:hypothetical protein